MRVLFGKEKRCMLGAMIVGITVLLLTGSCGSNSQSTGCAGTNNASFGSKIIISPASSTLDTGATGLVGVDNPVVMSIAVVLPDGVTPMSEACVTISGGMAVPNTIGAYQFYANNYTVGGPNITVNSPFTIQTDINGQFTITADELPVGTVFKDTIIFQSGAVVATATIEIT
jgi:hypothetical protein